MRNNEPSLTERMSTSAKARQAQLEKARSKETIVNWVNGVWLTATAATVAVMPISNSVFGTKWYAFAVDLPVFFIVGVATPLNLGILDRRKEVRERDGRRRQRNHTPHLRGARDRGSYQRR